MFLRMIMKFSSFYFIVAAIVCTVAADAFRSIPGTFLRGKFSISMTWKGDRPPLPNMEFLSQRMDASWGRGKYRSEVWEDKVNPLNSWWTAYAPSDEQTEAAAQGYDFKNPQAWFEVTLQFLFLSQMSRFNHMRTPHLGKEYRLRYSTRKI